MTEAAETPIIREHEFLSPIGSQYKVQFGCVEKGSQLNKQNFEDIAWYKRLYSLRKLSNSNIFNIAPDIEIIETPTNKTLINNNNMESILKDSENVKNYYALFTATDKNIIFSVFTISGDLYFILDSIDFLRENISNSIMEELITKVFNYSEQMLQLSKRDINSTDILKSDLISYLLGDLCIKLGSGFNDFEHNIQRLGHIMTDLLKSLFRDEPSSPTAYNLLLNQNEMYRTVLNKFMSNQDQVERRATERGILIGSKFFTAFQRYGYIYELGSGRWEKTLNMHPEFCLWHNVLYKIPEEYQDKFIIESLTFDPGTLREESFIIHANGKHPNVSSGGQVCIGGELCSEFKRLIRTKGLMAQEYVNFLARIEDALKVINFDSSYYDFKRATGKNPSDVLVRADIAKSHSSGKTSTLRRL